MWMSFLEWVQIMRMFMLWVKTPQKDPSVEEAFNNWLDKITLWIQS